MTNIQIFAFLVLPVAISVCGAAIAWYVGHGNHDENSRMHPGE